MTDQPKTLALDSSEWKALVLSNLARAHQAVEQAQAVTPEGLAMLNGHLDRIKGIARAWYASQPKEAVAPQGPAEAPRDETVKANGAGTTARKRGGWPKGKKRTPRVQQAAVQ